VNSFMEINQAIEIIKALADGVDPITGEVFDDESPYQHPQIIRALFLAISTLEKSKQVQSQRVILPSNAGGQWNEEEDKELLLGFKQGININELSQKHKRTKGAIQSRLTKHGFFKP
jgi:hypothetical protein